MSATNIVLILASLVYPVVRYNCFGSVEWAQVPLYVFNKSFCIYATAALLLHAWHRRKQRGQESDLWLHRTLLAAGCHVVISISILNGSYYGKLFDGCKMTLLGEAAMLAGIGASVIYWRSYCNSACVMRAVKVGLSWGAWLVAAHLALIGFKGWLTPAKWPAGMPPITLICFVATVAAAAMLSSKQAPAKNGAE